MDKEQLARNLKKAGFSDNESVIYITLLDYSLSKIGKIVKITGLQKSSCYLAINTLMHKGVVSSVNIGEIAYFQAENPKTILEYLEEKKEAVKDIIPDLEKRFSLYKPESSVKHFKGVKGVKAVFFDILREGKPNDVFGSEGQLSNKLPVFAKQYIRRQNEKKIRTRNLRGMNSKRKYSKGTTFRYVDQDIKSNVVTNIYGNKIAIIIWNEEPEAVIIESETTANSYKAYFEFMWKHAKPPKKTNRKV